MSPSGSAQSSRAGPSCAPGCRRKVVPTGRPVSIHSRERTPRGRGRVAIVDRKWSALPVPFAIEVPDRARKERYFDPGFYQLEAELLWSRVWQMACRLEEIPQPDDFVEYEILDQSIVVVRTEDLGVRAFQNACRHRGVRVVEGPGTCRAGSSARSTGGATAPTARTPSCPRRRRSPSTTCSPRTSISRRCGAKRGAGAPGSISTTRRRRCASASSPSPPSSTPGRWSRCGPSGGTPAVFPVNWKLAEEAFMEQYHVLETHPQLVIPGGFPPRDGGAIDPGLHRIRDPLPAHA